MEVLDVAFELGDEVSRRANHRDIAEEDSLSGPSPNTSDGRDADVRGVCGESDRTSVVSGERRGFESATRRPVRPCNACGERVRGGRGGAYLFTSEPGGDEEEVILVRYEGEEDP